MSRLPDGSRKVVLLTGAAGSLGSAFCRAHAADYDIVGVYHEQRPTVATNRQSFVDPLRAEEPLNDNVNPIFEIAADLTRPGEIARVVDLALARHDRIDLVVNTLGRPARGTLLAAGLRNAAGTFRLNTIIPLEVVACVTNTFWRHHETDNKVANRAVVNISATASVDVLDATNGAMFAASKAALNILTAHMAEELGPFHVRANVVAPGTFPAPVTTERVVTAIIDMIEGDETGRVLVLWSGADELL
jgi:NAD(P)-dependent dehydrogenase (short-subunit alcohol dehydrogenase family)